MQVFLIARPEGLVAAIVRRCVGIAQVDVVRTSFQQAAAHREAAAVAKDQGPGTFLAFFYTDYLAWAGLENAVSAKKATDIYLDLWRTFPPLWAEDARVDLWAGKPKTAQDLADILSYCEKKKYMPYNITESNGRVTLTSTLNPYTEVMGLFGFKKGCSYFKAVTKRDTDFINQVLKETKTDKKFKATLTKAISEGDTVNQIVIAKK